MDTYLDRINRKETIKEVKRHLIAFCKFCKIDGVTDFVKISEGLITPQDNIRFDDISAVAINASNCRSSYINWLFHGIMQLDNDEEKEIIKLRYLNGYSEEDVSEVLHQHEITIRKKLNIACINLALILRIEILSHQEEMSICSLEIFDNEAVFGT